MSRWVRLKPECQVDAWQLISVNINRQRSSEISTMKEKCWGVLTGAHTLLPSSRFDRPSLGMSPIWNCLGMCVCYGCKSGFATLLVSEHFRTIKRSLDFEERCTAILLGTTLVMAAYAPASGKSTELYEAFISSVLKVLREGPRGGARDFYITGDLNVELGMMYRRKRHRGAP